MKTPKYTIRSFKNFALALIEEYRRNAEKYGFFNDANYPTIFQMEKVSDGYKLYHLEGAYLITKATFLYFVRRSTESMVPVCIND